MLQILKLPVLSWTCYITHKRNVFPVLNSLTHLLRRVVLENTRALSLCSLCLVNSSVAKRFCSLNVMGPLRVPAPIIRASPIHNAASICVADVLPFSFGTNWGYGRLCGYYELLAEGKCCKFMLKEISNKSRGRKVSSTFLILICITSPLFANYFCSAKRNTSSIAQRTELNFYMLPCVCLILSQNVLHCLCRYINWRWH
jgi:hypothetical protein